MLISIETGERRRLTTVPNGNYADFSAAFSPDGRTLVFTRDVTGFSNDLYLLSLDTNLKPSDEPRRLTKDNRTIWNSVWAPDGRSVIVSMGTPGNASLWRVDIGGNNPPQRLTSQVDATKLTISARSKRLVFCQSTRDLDIFRATLSPETGQVQSVMPLIVSSRLDRYPSYSPDGNRIAFASLRSGDWQVWVTDGDGGNVVQLTSLQRSAVQNPVWKADGRQIEFVSNPDGAYRSYVIDAGGGKPRLLDEGEAKEFIAHAFHAPNVSIDGRIRYFQENGSVKSVPVSGGEARTLFKTAGSYEIQPSPKGIYSVTNAFPLVPGSLHFYPFPNGPLTPIMSAELVSAYGLSLSPDNRYLLYTKMSFAGSDLMLVENLK
jgi:Tol biopolymer transport system component